MSAYLPPDALDRPFDPKEFNPEVLQGQYQEITNLLLASHCGIKAIKTKLEILSDEMQIQDQRNPIEYIRSRIKSFDSIVGKLQRRGFPVTVESARRELYDIAGVRVVYIRNPKPSGYRSYHMIVEVPVYFSNHSEQVRVEVQIRTIAMDFWATLEHQLNYKRGLDADGEIARKLRACADSIAGTDREMQVIRDMVDSLDQPQETLDPLKMMAHVANIVGRPIPDREKDAR